MPALIGQVAQAEYPDSIYIVRKPESDILLGDILKIIDRITGQKYLVRVYNAYHGLTSISERLASLATKMPGIEAVIKPEHFYDIYVACPLCIIIHDQRSGKVSAKPTKTLPTQLSPVYLPDPEDFGFIKELQGYDLPIGTLRARTTKGTENIEIGIKGEFIPRHIGVYAITGKGKTNFVMVLILSMLREAGKYSALIFDAHNEYYYGSGTYARRLEGLRKVEPVFQGRLHYYDLKRRDALKISPVKLTPEDVRKVIDLTEVQYEASLVYFDVCRGNLDGNPWIFRVLSDADRLHQPVVDEEEKKARGGFLPQGVRPPTVLALARKLRIMLSAGVLYEKREAPTYDLISDIISKLNEGGVVILNTKDLSDLEESLVTSVLSDRVLDERRRTPPEELARKPITLIVLEEALSVLSEEVLSKGTNIFARIVREGRKFRIGLIPVVQIPRRLDPDIASQINTCIILGTAQHADRQAIAESAQQDLATLINEMKMLDIGEAVIAFPAEVPFPLPVVIYHFNEYADRVLRDSKIQTSVSHVKTSEVDENVAPPSL
jgi:hypothetical protein